MNFSILSDYCLILKWYLIGRLKIGRKHRKKKAALEFDTYLNSLKKNSLVIDAGANLGEITKKFLDKNLIVHAFEPDPLAIKNIDKKIIHNKNLIFNSSAIGLKNEEKLLFRFRKFNEDNPYTTEGSSLISYRGVKGKPNVKIKVIDFIEYIENLKTHISLIKIDIEGKEIEIINKLINKNLHKRIDMIFVETHERFSHHLAIETCKLRLKLKKLGIKNINLDWH